MSARKDIPADPKVALSGDLLGTVGLVLGGQGLAAACVLALALLDGWLAWSLVAVMVVGGLALCTVTGAGRRLRGR